eukprot:TRINITY_DN17015_c0_g1_i1.p1 TRINITY_DN17015_c0_g1~~TRINITY_DN17015_c0_g1_i1.p1  ORF type:complete len:193 (-),score=47.87 TRINITY_DN17015_c0_g1_i1:106-654(-)
MGEDKEVERKESDEEVEEEEVPKEDTTNQAEDEYKEEQGDEENEGGEGYIREESGVAEWDEEGADEVSGGKDEQQTAVSDVGTGGRVHPQQGSSVSQGGQNKIDFAQETTQSRVPQTHGTPTPEGRIVDGSQQQSANWLPPAAPQQLQPPLVAGTLTADALGKAFQQDATSLAQMLSFLNLT